MGAASYFDEVPEYSIENGVVRCQTKAGNAYFMALPVFRKTVHRMLAFLEEHDASGDVVPFGRNRKR